MLPAQPELIPVRALNQVSYCPRLYYPALSGTSCLGVLAAFAVSFGRISPDTAEPLRPDWRGGVRAAVRTAGARSRVKDHEPGRSTNPARAFSIWSR
jgi:hypothetical protein